MTPLEGACLTRNNPPVVIIPTRPAPWCYWGGRRPPQAVHPWDAPVPRRDASGGAPGTLASVVNPISCMFPPARPGLLVWGDPAGGNSNF